MAAIPPRTNIDGIKKAVMDGIDGAFERGKKYGRYLALQEYLHQKEESKPKWISVKERLPEQFVSVLVYMPDEFPWPTVHQGHLRPDGKWNAAHNLCTPDEVTHWMPLPEPPKEEAYGTKGTAEVEPHVRPARGE